MEDDFRNPSNKYLKMEDVLAMDIPYLAPIEIVQSPNAQDDLDRGDISERGLLYYVGVKSKGRHDSLQHHRNLVNGEPGDEEQGIMLPMIDSIRVLKGD